MNPMVCLNLFVLAPRLSVVREARRAIPSFNLQPSTFNFPS